MITLQDIRVLQIPLIVLAVITAFSTAGILVSRSNMQQAEATLQNQQTTLNQAQQRYRLSGEEKEIIIRHLPTYKELEKNGFIGAEQRINWLDALRTTNQAQQMFGVEYQIAAQQPYPTGAGMESGQFQLRQSPMKLTFKLLHEGDLMRFFTTLAQLKVGMFTLEECVLQRAGSNIPTIRYQPTLQADCQLDWWTITPKESQGNKP